MSSWRSTGRPVRLSCTKRIVRAAVWVSRPLLGPGTLVRDSHHFGDRTDIGVEGHHHLSRNLLKALGPATAATPLRRFNLAEVSPKLRFERGVLLGRVRLLGRTGDRLPWQHGDSPWGAALRSGSR